MTTAVRTLGDLRAHGMALNARCNGCGHRRDLNTDDLIKKLGEDWVIIGNALDKALRCIECENLGASVQVHLLGTDRSRFAD